jgi:hypothetical protein
MCATGWSGELGRFRQAAEGIEDTGGDLLGADSMYLGQDAATFKLLHNGPGLLVVQVQAVSDDGFIVVRACRLLRPMKHACNELFVSGRQLQDAGRTEVVDLTTPLSAATPTLELPAQFANLIDFSLEEVSAYNEPPPDSLLNAPSGSANNPLVRSRRGNGGH